MANQNQITLFPGVKILSKFTMNHAEERLRKYCTIDVLGDTLYAKKLGNDNTTYAIDFSLDEISKIRKIKDKNGNNIDETIFENDCDDFDDDEFVETRLN